MFGCVFGFEGRQLFGADGSVCEKLFVLLLLEGFFHFYGGKVVVVRRDLDGEE